MNEGQGVMARCRAVLMCAVAVALLGPAAARAAKVECSIEGVTDEAIVKNIEVTLSIFRDRDRDDLTPESIARLHDRARIEIRRALEPFGYYHPSIDAKLTAEKDDHFRARYVITLGDPVRVREVSLSITGEGKSRPPFQVQLLAVPLTRGRPYEYEGETDCEIDH
jgi:translocation and assembly module TamA